MRKLDKAVSRFGLNLKELFFPRGFDFLIFKTFERFEKDDRYFILNKYNLCVERISKDDYYSYIDKIDSFHFNTIFKLSRLSSYTFKVKK